jgi:hypothetical protein
MTFTDPGTSQPDPNQPLTLDRPQSDSGLPPPYPRIGAYSGGPRSAPQRSAMTLPASTFVPYSDSRGPTGWGQTDWRIQAATMHPGPDSGPDNPSAAEAYPIIARFSGQLAKWGSDNVSGLASQVRDSAMSFAPLLDMLSKGGFSANFNASSLNAIKIRQQRMLVDTEEMLNNHNREMMDYARVFAVADASPDDNAVQEEARQELRFLADVKYGHPYLVSALDNKGGLATARRIIDNEDAWMRNIWASQTSLKKATGTGEDEETAKEWGENPRAAVRGGGRGIFGSPLGREEDQQDGSSQAPQPPQTESTGEFNNRLSREMHLTPKEMEAVDEQVATGRPSEGVEALGKGKQTPLDDLIRRKIGLGVQAKNAEINRIAGDDSLSPEKKIAGIANLNPRAAAEISGVADYRLNPREEGVVNRQRFAQLTGQIFKNYNQANFANANKFYDTNATENKVIVRTNDLVQNWKTLLKALEPIGENKSIPREQIEAWLAGHGTGDPEYDQVYSQIRNIATQINAIQTLTGTPRVTLVHDIVANLTKDASPRSVRAQLLPDIQDAYAIVNSYQNQWEGFGKKTLMPAMSPDTFRDYRAIVRMNPYTGEVPEDAGPELKSVGLSPDRSSTRLTPDQKLTPLTLRAISQMKSKIALWEHSPDPALRQKAQDYNRRIGPVSNIDRRIPGVDENLNATR